MDNLISVLIVDDNVELANLIREKLEQYSDLVIKGIANDGLEAISMIKDVKPEIVILDVIMPNLDGIGVLEQVKEMKMVPRPVFMMLTAVGHDIFVKKTMELGADYFIMKPFDINILVSRIKQICMDKRNTRPVLNSDVKKAGNPVNTDQENNYDMIDRTVTSLINNMGITPNLVGFHYLRDAVKMSLGNPSMLRSVAKRIYPVIAVKYNTTTRNVDRAIRCALKGAEKKMGNSKNESLAEGFNSINKCNNTQVISFIVNKVETETGFAEKINYMTK